MHTMEKNTLTSRRIRIPARPLLSKPGRFHYKSSSIGEKQTSVSPQVQAWKMPVQPQGYIKCKKYDCL